MTKETSPAADKGRPSPDKKKRLAEALRRNLAKRKDKKAIDPERKADAE